MAAPIYRYLPAPVYTPSLVMAPVAPQVYIERGDAQPAPAQSSAGWWYYCEVSGSYYPYVEECAQEWLRVAAEPPAVR